MLEMKEFHCITGKTYMMPKNHCVFCKNCFSILCDYENGPYMCMCEFDKEYEENCTDFKEDEDDENNR